MDNEKENLPSLEDMDMPALPPEELSEADREAQLWLEELLAATAPAATESTDPVFTEDAVMEEIAPAQMPSFEGTTAEEPAKQEAAEPTWLQDLESPAEETDRIGADELAVAQHEMADLADIELEKIIQEALSEEWDNAAIQSEIMAHTADLPETTEAPLYTDDGDEPDEPEIDSKRKVRPKRKNGYGLFGLPHLASTAVWAVMCLAIGISLGRVLWLCAADVLAFGRPNQSVIIEITDEDDLDSITEKLYNAGLIQYRDLFKLYANLTGVTEKGKISSGVFTLNTLYDYHALVAGMSSTSSYRETIEVVIPEGYTCAQIFKLLEESGVCTAAELEQYCETSSFSSYWFLEDVEKGNKYCLEGFLFPDTYEFYTNSSAKLVFITFLNGFNNHFGEDMQQLLQQLNTRLEAMYAKNGASASFKPFTVKDVVTVASMIEKETAHSGESPLISSVIYNRLSDPADYPYLNIDATVIYALGGKGSITSEDLKFDSPYNTYVTKGLPAGPISNPGINSLKAALNPQDTNYHYYALDTTEEVRIHKFFATFEEHKNFLDSLR